MSGGVHLTLSAERCGTPCDGARYQRHEVSTSCVVLESEGHQSIVSDLGDGLRACDDIVTERASTVLPTHLERSSA